jgi:hypothetical protein
MPQKLWVIGEEVLADDFNDYVQNQIVAAFPNAAARTTQWPAPPEGAVSYLADVNTYQSFNGSAWVVLAPRVVPGNVWVGTAPAAGAAYKELMGAALIATDGTGTLAFTIPDGGFTTCILYANVINADAGGAAVGFLAPQVASCTLTTWVGNAFPPASASAIIGTVRLMYHFVGV